LGRSLSCGNAFVDDRDKPGHDDEGMAFGGDSAGYDVRGQRCSPRS
jgi:hypothetical protein